MKKLGQEIKGGVTAVKGFTASGLFAGIKKNKQLDMALIVSDRPCIVAALFTKNRFPAAPILLTQRHFRKGICQAIIANSGNANAFTGCRGDEDAATMANGVAEQLGIPPGYVCVASTGVIGEPLPIHKIAEAIPLLIPRLSETGGTEAAQAIMTTDTFHKEVAYTDGKGRSEIRVGGMAKGSGMIHPNMATMLAFLTTNVAITVPLLKEGLKLAADQSFNRISVDGETSTNDLVVCMANGSGPKISSKGIAYQRFVALLTAASCSLAKMIVQDGEGATKQIQVTVEGAPHDKAAHRVAEKVACSPLVKTAFFAEDANWGRIVAAIGNAGVAVSPEKLDLSFDAVVLVKAGEYQGEAVALKVATVLKQREIRLTIHLHSGVGRATVWTSDLSYDYVKINAAYRT